MLSTFIVSRGMLCSKSLERHAFQDVWKIVSLNLVAKGHSGSEI